MKQKTDGTLCGEELFEKRDGMFHVKQRVVDALCGGALLGWGGKSFWMTAGCRLFHVKQEVAVRFEPESFETEDVECFT